MSRIEQLVRPGTRPVRGGVALPLVGVAIACLAFYAHAQINQNAKPAPAARRPVKAAEPVKKAAPRPRPQPLLERTPDMNGGNDVEPAPVVVEQVFEALATIKAQGTTILLVEQNVRHALRLADYAYVINRGVVVAQGRADEVTQSIDSAYLS